MLAKKPADRMVLQAAVPWNKSSAGGWFFDPWAEMWIAAMSGVRGSGSALATSPDDDQNERVSSFESYDFALGIDDPVMGESSAGISKQVYLATPLPKLKLRDDKIKNGAESDLDCGAGCTLKCASGQSCTSGADCGSGLCHAVTRRCVDDPCADGARSAQETDVDCGGPTCGACALGRQCTADRDCASAACRTTCVASFSLGARVSGVPLGERPSPSPTAPTASWCGATERSSSPRASPGPIRWPSRSSQPAPPVQ